jgi:hypothetical protein
VELDFNIQADFAEMSFKITGGSISVWAPHPYLPQDPCYNPKKVFQHSKAYYKIPNIKPPIKLCKKKFFHCQNYSFRKVKSVLYVHLPNNVEHGNRRFGDSGAFRRHIAASFININIKI